MWTMENTEGFTQDEIDMINTVVERIWGETIEADESYLSNINDAANNEWREGITETELEAGIRSRLGQS
jgi:hypothetical protein